MYFNFIANVNLDDKFRRRRTKIRRYSTNRIYMSKTEMKHTNDKVVITIYTYNRSKKYLYKRLFSLYKKIFANNYRKNQSTINLFKPDRNFFKLRSLIKKSKNFGLLKKLYIVRHFKRLYVNKFIYDKLNVRFNRFNLFRSIYTKSSSLLNNFTYNSKVISGILKEKNLNSIINNLNNKHICSDNTNLFINRLESDYIQQVLSKEILYMNYNQLSLIEDYRFNNIYLNKLNNIISSLYGKKVEFNIVNLKYMHLDSSILSNSMALKLRNRKNKPIRILKKALSLVKIDEKNKYRYDIQQKFSNNFNMFNMYNIHDNPTHSEQDMLDLVIGKLFNKKSLYSTSISNSFKNKFIFRSIKLRKIRGIRLEAKGRLTKRLTASRSFYKFRYKGSLQNLDNARGLSSLMLRGSLRSNLDYTNVNAKTRNGSFGLKG